MQERRLSLHLAQPVSALGLDQTLTNRLEHRGCKSVADLLTDPLTPHQLRRQHRLTRDQADDLHYKLSQLFRALHEAHPRPPPASFAKPRTDERTGGGPPRAQPQPGGELGQPTQQEHPRAHARGTTAQDPSTMHDETSPDELQHARRRTAAPGGAARDLGRGDPPPGRRPQQTQAHPPPKKAADRGGSRIDHDDLASRVPAPARPPAEVDPGPRPPPPPDAGSESPPLPYGRPCRRSDTCLSEGPIMALMGPSRSCPSSSATSDAASRLASS